MTDGELDRLEQLAAAATPGPWQWYHPSEFPHDIRVARASKLVRNDPVRGYVFRMTHSHSKKWSGSADGAHLDPSEDDARFIVAARAAVPELIAEVQRLRAELRRLSDTGPA
jgi:hypothetical protein